MAIPLFVIAVLLFAAAYQNQLGYFAQNAEQDVKGFLPWAAAMAAIGAIGIIPKGKPVSNMLFGLVFLVMLVKNKGFFDNIANKGAFTPVSPPKAPPAPGADFKPPAAAPGVKQSGDFGAAAPSSGFGAPGSNGNVIPFPKLNFGGSLLPGIGSVLQ